MALLQIFDVTCNESVTEANAVEVATVPAGLYAVTKVTIWIPDGHAGLTGIALAYGHNPVVPMNGTFLSANDEVFSFEMGNDYPPGVAWSVFLCNLDLQPHNWETRWELSSLTPSTPTPVAPSLTAADILAAGVAAGVGA